MKYNLILSIVFCYTLLLINFAGAFEFDNIKTYNPIAKEVTFKNSFLGIPTTEIAKVKLVNYGRYCYPGECYLNMELNIKEGDLESLKDVTYYLLNYGKIGDQITRTKVYEIYDPNLEYTETRKEITCISKDPEEARKNFNDPLCWEDYNVNLKGKWINYDPTNKLSAGIYNLRIKVDINEGETIDVIPNIYGISINEWVAFTGLTRYEYNYPVQNNLEWINFDTTTANFQSNQIFKIGTLGTNETFNVSGVQIKIVDGGINLVYINVFIVNANTSRTGCIWNSTIGYKKALNVTGAGLFNVTLTKTGMLNKGGAYCLIINATATSEFGTSSRRLGSTYAGGTTVQRNGAINSGTDIYFGIWGAVVLPPTVATVTLVAPVNRANLSYANINFLATLVSTVNITNGTLYVDNVKNTPITINNKTFLFNTTKTLAEGRHNWTVLARNTLNEKGWPTSNYSLLVDLTDPVVNITLPLNITYVTFKPTKVIPLNFTARDNFYLRRCYLFNITNKSITCGTNTTYNVSAGSKYISYYANDSAGNSASMSRYWFMNYVRPYFNGSATAVEGENTTIYFNITANSITQVNATLNYNNTVYNMNFVAYNATKIKFYYTVKAPVVNTNTNIKYNITYYFSGQKYNSSTFTQKIYNIPPLNITAGKCIGKPVYWFNLKDEENATALIGEFEYNFYYGLSNSSLVRSYGKIIGTTNFSICTNTTISPSWTIGSGEIFYNSLGYVDRRYYIFDDTVVSTATNITLYDLVSTVQTSFKLEVEDNSLNPYDNIYTRLLRWYPDLNEYKIVDIGKTDGKGSTVIHVRTEDVDYRIGAYETNGSLIYLADPIRMICLASPCTYTLKISPGEIDYTSFLSINYVFTYNETTGIWYFSYSDTSGNTNIMNLTVYRVTSTTIYPVCDDVITGAVGVLSCDTSIYTTGELRAEVQRQASPPVTIVQKVVHLSSTAFKGSTFGLWLSLLLAIPIIFLFVLVSPISALFGGVIALIPALYFGSINMGIVGGLAILAGIVAHFLKRIN
jgi:hypothetical protein